MEHLRDIERFWLVLLPPSVCVYVCVCGATPLWQPKPTHLWDVFNPNPRTSSQRLGEHGERSDLSHGYGLCDDFSGLVQGALADDAAFLR